MCHCTVPGVLELGRKVVALAAAAGGSENCMLAASFDAVSGGLCHSTILRRMLLKPPTLVGVVVMAALHTTTYPVVPFFFCTKPTAQVSMSAVLHCTAPLKGPGRVCSHNRRPRCAAQ
jgi:hypothetical protein